MRTPESVHPKALPSIQGCDQCEPDRRPRMYVCDFHDGYEFAIEQFDTTVAELIRQRDEARADAEQGWALLDDLLNDVDNWGCSPHPRYEQALAAREAGR